MTLPKVNFENTSFSGLKEYLRKSAHSKVFVLADKNTEKFCLPLLSHLKHSFLVISINPGEQNKTLKSVQKIWDFLFKHEASRDDLLICLGGGMILDMGGFAASTYKRGMKFLFVPTTLLSMVDATIGGKTAINFLGYKNAIGLFQIPETIFVNTKYLNTLPKREYTSGLGEVIKHYLIADRKAFLALSEKGIYDHEKLIKKAIAIKSKIVKKDFKESNLRKILNAGHTIGHAIESAYISKGKKITHGEAVAIGLYYETRIAVELGLLKTEEFSKIEKILRIYFEIPLLKKKDINLLLPYILQDKKNKSGKIKMALIDKIGNCIPSVEVKLNDLLLVTKR